jgi:hypothetical protein
MPYEYEIFNELRRFKTATDCYADCFRTIAYLAPESLEAIAKRLAGPRRNHLARARSLVYPGRPDLAGPAREIAPDWFLGTNIDAAGMKHFMHVACFTAGLEFGVDVKIIKWGRT